MGEMAYHVNKSNDGKLFFFFFFFFLTIANVVCFDWYIIKIMSPANLYDNNVISITNYYFFCTSRIVLCEKTYR